MADLPHGKGFEKGSDTSKVESTPPNSYTSQELRAALARFDEDRQAQHGLHLKNIDRQLVEMNFYLRAIAQVLSPSGLPVLDERVREALDVRHTK